MRNKLFILFLFISLLSSAQTYKYIGVEDGLSNKRVYSIHKDKKGYMWFLTHDGIDRYDGKSFKHYKLSCQDGNVCSFADMNKTVMDNQGFIWEVTKSGCIFKYNDVTDCYEYIFKVNSKEQITSTYLDHNDNIWLCTSKRQFLFKTITKELITICNIKKQEVTNIVQAEKNLYYFVTPNEVYAAKLQHNTLIRVKQKGLDNQNLHINKIYYHPINKKLFLGSVQDGVYVYETQKKQLLLTKIELEDININKFKKLNNNEILIATNGAGVYKMNTNNYQSQPYILADYNKLNSMNGNTILDLYIDSEQRIWLANYPIGITVQYNHFPKFEWYKHAIGNTNTLINDPINAIIEDSQGDLWFATNDGISIYRSQSKQWSHILHSSSNNENRSHIIVTLCEVSPGVIWAGGYASGVFQIQKGSMTITNMNPSKLGNNNLQASRYLHSIIKDQQGVIWSGGYHLLRSINLKNNQVKEYPGVTSINMLLEKDANHLWVGTASGLYILDKAKGRYRRIKLPYFNTYIYTLHQEKNGILYIGTSNNGLIVYNPKTNHIVNYLVTNSPLLSNNIYTILSDNKGTLFFSTENSLVKYSIRNNTFQNWTKEQGLLSNEFNATSGAHRKNGNFVFGSLHGAVEFNEKIQLPSNYSSKLVFSEFITYEKSPHENKESILEKNIDETKKIYLKYNQNVFTFKLASINYDNPSNILYSWKLDGLYNEWNKPSKESTIRYTNLNSGKYKFCIRAISNETGQIIEEKSMDIIIQPPFWRSIWAFLVYIIILVFITRIPLRYYNMRKEGKISNEKINFFINTAHDIRTPLSLIKAPLDELCDNEELSEEGKINLATAIKNTNTLFKLITNLINFEKAELYSSKMHVGEYELFTFLEEILDHFKSYAETNHIRLVYESNFRFLNVWFDKDKMESILKNLISNAIKYTPQNGEVRIYAFSTLDNWGIEVIDNGIGIPENEQNKLFRLFFRGSNAINSKIAGTGIGLLLVYKLVNYHHGSISLKSKENQGSTFKISFPQGHRHFKKNQLEWTLEETKENDELLSEFKTKSAEVLPPSIIRTGNASQQRILLVEDNDDLRTYLQRTLSETYYIYLASDGEKGWKVVENVRPDLVISDIMMPKMRGDELCTKIKSDINTSHIPVILLTALNDKTNIINGLRNGADEYISKPFDIAILKATIATILSNRQIIKNKFATLDIQVGDEYIHCASDLDREFMTKVQTIIEKNIPDSSFTVDTLCAALNMSRSSFYNKIKALTDQAPADFIRIIRLARAAELLKRKQYSIAEVAEMTGFSDAKYFREVFKKCYKVSPSKYVQEENGGSCS